MIFATPRVNYCFRNQELTTVEGTSAIWWRNLFSEKRLSPRFSALGQRAIQIWILEVSIISSKIFKELCLINYLTWRPAYCYFKKRITLNLEKKQTVWKYLSGQTTCIYVLAVRVGRHLFCLWRAAQVRASIKSPQVAWTSGFWNILSMEWMGKQRTLIATNSNDFAVVLSLDPCVIDC